ncbi:hypothetical protein CYJ36_02075 [Bacillus sp. UMB0893]|nr:hypothetical protein CYJ36_02075 [Bacillus sp. UMB0893]
MYHSQSMSDKEIVFDITEMIVKETKRIEKKGAVDFRCRHLLSAGGMGASISRRSQVPSATIHLRV